MSGDGSFDSGLLAGEFPGPAGYGTEAVVVTGGRSSWLGDRCAGCGQTFRRGDRVRLGPDAGVRHEMPGLDCGAMSSEAAPIAEEVDIDDGFAAGVQSEWPAPGGVPVFRLSERDWQVTRPTSGSTTPTCAGCAHTFRAGDMVIVCPCATGPDDPRRAYCQIAVHRDPARGLTCWDDWAPTGRLRRCPRTWELLEP